MHESLSILRNLCYRTVRPVAIDSGSALQGFHMVIESTRLKTTSNVAVHINDDFTWRNDYLNTDSLIYSVASPHMFFRTLSCLSEVTCKRSCHGKEIELNSFQHHALQEFCNQVP